MTKLSLKYVFQYFSGNIWFWIDDKSYDCPSANEVDINMSEYITWIHQGLFY